MAKTYEIYHNGQYVPATYIEDTGDVEFITIEYEHTDHDEETGEPLPAVTRRTNVKKDDSALKITETED